MNFYSPSQSSEKDRSRKMLQQRIASLIQGELEVPFEALLLEVHAYQRQHNLAYANYCKNFPPPQHWGEIPAVPQEAFKHYRLATFPEEETVRVFHTSGTTGKGTGKHAFSCLELYELAARTGWKREGLSGLRTLALLPHPQQAPHSSLAQMAAWWVPQKDFFLHDGNWKRLEASLGGKEPLLLFGTALAFLDWFCTSVPRTLPPGSLAVETGGYKGSSLEISKTELYTRFEEHLGLPPDAVFNEYGMTELSSQFYSHGLHRPHREPPWARALVIDPETETPCAVGQTGVLRLFDLANLDSVCAVQTQDLAIQRTQGFELLGRDPTALPRGCSRLSPPQ